MEKQNVTLSIPKHLWQQAKILAKKRHQSLSSLLSTMIVELVENEERYEEGKQRSLDRLATAGDLQGDHNWSRESLHER